MKFDFTTIFSSSIRPLVSEEKDKYLSLASLVDVGNFIPNIDTNANMDLLPIAFNACVVNRVNKNGDVIDSSIATEVYKNFINKPINIEHNRANVVGVILSAGFSEFGTDLPLTEEQVKDKKEPYNITLGGVVWKIVNKDLVDTIEESNDPTSKNYMRVSASWELGYNDYEIAVLDNSEKNIETASFISDKEEIEKLKPKLTGFGGTGKLNETQSIYRKIKGRVLPLGIGLTATPAADVIGVSVKKPESEVMIEQKAQEISQTLESNVIKERINMNISEVSQITDELLKEAQASSIRDFIGEQLKLASEKYSAEIQQKENAIKEAQEKYTSLSADAENLKAELTSVKESLEQLKLEKASREKQEQFSTRMASLDEEFDLDEQDREVIANDIRDLDEDSFAAYKKKMGVLMKEKSKAYKATKKEKEMPAMEKKEMTASENQEVAASTENLTIVDDAISNGTEQKDSITAGVVSPSLTLKQKYQNAFSSDNFVITK
jgi:hypothetical protein